MGNKDLTETCGCRYPATLHCLCATTWEFCSTKLPILVQDDRNRSNMSKHWDNSVQQEENVISGMIAMAATSSFLGQKTILWIQ